MRFQRMNFAYPRDPRRALSPGDFKEPFAAGPGGRKSAPRAAHLDHFEVAAHNQELNAKLDKAEYLLAVEQNDCRVLSKDDKYDTYMFVFVVYDKYMFRIFRYISSTSRCACSVHSSRLYRSCKTSCA